MDALPAFVIGAATASFVWAVTLLTDNYVRTLRAVKREAREAVESANMQTPLELPAQLLIALNENGYTVSDTGRVLYKGEHITNFEALYSSCKTIEMAMDVLNSLAENAKRRVAAQEYLCQQINAPQQ